MKNAASAICLLLLLAQAAHAFGADAQVNISIDVQGEDVANVYKYIAREAGYNVVIHPAVSGTITLKLIDLPWQQVLSVVLEMMGHEARLYDSTMLIAPIGSL